MIAMMTTMMFRRRW